jgi:acetyl esterase/lipase
MKRRKNAGPEYETIEKETGRPFCRYYPDLEYAVRFNNRQISIPVSLKLQLFVNANDKSKNKPLLIFVPGGGYRHPQVYVRVPLAVRLAEETGFPVAMPEYRGTETDAFPAMVEDIRAAVRYMKINAKLYGIDSDKIVLMGGSAGGHAVLLAAYSGNRFDNKSDRTDISAGVAGVIDLYGPSDISKLEFDKNISETEKALSPSGRLFGCVNPEKNRDLVEPSIVSEYLRKGADLPPALIVHGDSDCTVPFSQSELLYHAMKDAGADVAFYALKHAGHADEAFFYPNMIKLYADFIKRITGTSA